MSRMVNRMKDLGAKARALKEAFDQAPGAVADIRRTLSETTDQVQLLKTEVQESVEELKDLKDLKDVKDVAGTGPGLAALLQELPAALEALRRAGIPVAGVDLETGARPRLLLRLPKASLPTAAAFRALVTAAPASALLAALHAALEGAEPLLTGIHLPGLEDRDLLVALGDEPTVRLSWRLPESPRAVLPPNAPEPFPADRPIPLAPTSPKAPPPPIQPSQAQSPEPLASRWGADTLARFKKLPPITKGKA